MKVISAGNGRPRFSPGRAPQLAGSPGGSGSLVCCSSATSTSPTSPRARYSIRSTGSSGSPICHPFMATPAAVPATSCSPAPFTTSSAAATPASLADSAAVGSRAAAAEPVRTGRDLAVQRGRPGIQTRDQRQRADVTAGDAAEPRVTGVVDVARTPAGSRRCRRPAHRGSAAPSARGAPSTAPRRSADGSWSLRTAASHPGRTLGQGEPLLLRRHDAPVRHHRLVGLRTRSNHLRTRSASKDVMRTMVHPPALDVRRDGARIWSRADGSVPWGGCPAQCRVENVCSDRPTGRSQILDRWCSAWLPCVTCVARVQVSA